MTCANLNMSLDYLYPTMIQGDENEATMTGSGGEEVESPPRRDAPIPQPATTSVDKPPYSYIALISMAILGSPDRRLVLGDIYENIRKRFAYYRLMREKAWRNSIRHNLSLNECFVKSGRAENGKGHYWRIHPACVADFTKGNYCRRQARQRARRASRASPAAVGRPTGSHVDSGYVPMTQVATGMTSYPFMQPPSYPSAVISACLPYRYPQTLTPQSLDPMTMNAYLQAEGSARGTNGVTGFRAAFPLMTSLSNIGQPIEQHSDKRFADLQ